MSATWSSLAEAINSGPALINRIVYSEFAFACDRIEDVDELLPAHLYDDRPIPRDGAFLAPAPTPPTASRECCPLLTRDQRRCASPSQG